MPGRKRAGLMVATVWAASEAEGRPALAVRAPRLALSCNSWRLDKGILADLLRNSDTHSLHFLP